MLSCDYLFVLPVCLSLVFLSLSLCVCVCCDRLVFGRIDEQIPFMSNIMLAQAFALLGALAVISYTMPLFLLTTLPLGYAYYRIQR